jgi:hypothetical protein
VYLTHISATCCDELYVIKCRNPLQSSKYALKHIYCASTMRTCRYTLFLVNTKFGTRVAYIKSTCPAVGGRKESTESERNGESERGKQRPSGEAVRKPENTVSHPAIGRTCGHQAGPKTTCSTHWASRAKAQLVSRIYRREGHKGYESGFQDRTRKLSDGVVGWLRSYSITMACTVKLLSRTGIEPSRLRNDNRHEFFIDQGGT